MKRIEEHYIEARNRLIGAAVAYADFLDPDSVCDQDDDVRLLINAQASQELFVEAVEGYIEAERLAETALGFGATR